MLSTAVTANWTDFHTFDRTLNDAIARVYLLFFCIYTFKTN